MARGMDRPFRIGTRGSPLALTQARMVADGLRAAYGWDADAIETIVIRTTGDRVQDRALAEIGGKALWTKELDRALLAGEIDCAVHSMKDVETLRPDTIAIAAMLPRADPRDRLIGADRVAALPRCGDRHEFSRRQAQLLRLRPDLQIVLLRGNVDTRLSKVANGTVDATLLAAAGLDRLGRPEIGAAVPLDVMLPAPAQGAVGIETRADDLLTRHVLKPINHADTYACVMVERDLLAHLQADCHSPVAALATIYGERLTLRAELLTEDGAAHVGGEASGGLGDLTTSAILARDLLDRAPPAVRTLFGG